MEKMTLIGIIAAAVCLVLLSGLTGHLIFPRTETVTVPGPVQNVTVTETVYVDRNVTVEKLVDNGKLDMLVDYAVAMGFFDDSEDVLPEVEFKNLALDLAVVEIKENGFDEFDDTDYRDADFGDFKDSEISINKVYSDLDEVVVDDIDYDDKEATIVIEAQIKGKDGSDVVKNNYLFTVFVDSEGCEIENIEAA